METYLIANLICVIVKNDFMKVVYWETQTLRKMDSRYPYLGLTECSSFLEGS